MQEDVFNFSVDSGLVWQLPNGVDSAKLNFPVTQVSFNDAIAYCKWAEARLPNYDEFWMLSTGDKRQINENLSQILPLSDVSVIGNVWDITTTENTVGEIRLAGGSYLCHPNTCDGTNPNRRLYVDKTTGNTNIGFSIIYLKE